MAPSIEAAPPPAGQQNVRRPIPLAPIVPAVPLVFMKKRKGDGTAQSKKMNGTQHVNGHTNGVTSVDAQNEPAPPAVNGVQAEEPSKRERRKESLRVVTRIPESPKDVAIDGDSKQDRGK